MSFDKTAGCMGELAVEDAYRLLGEGEKAALVDVRTQAEWAFVGVPDQMARRVRDDFFPKSLLDPDEIKGIDSLMKDAVELKFIAEPLTKEQLAQLIQLQPPMTH